jgi:hypothetical protein
VENDADGDGLSNGAEALYGTDPHNPDTDGDGVADGAEVLAETDPLNAASVSNQPAAVPASSIGVRLFLGLLLFGIGCQQVTRHSRVRFKSK